jgi:ribonuclease BN (tRNA processing enzyme)
MLTLTFLGVGSAFAKRNFQSNVLIEAWERAPDDQEAPDDSLLVDFGATGPLALYHLMQRPGFGYLCRDGKINYPAIKRVCITHTHADHIGGLEELAIINAYVFSRGQRDGSRKPGMISSHDILPRLWEHSLKGGLGAMAGRYVRLEDYFDPVSLQPGRPGHDDFSMLGHYRLRLFPTDHIQVQRPYDWPSCGLFIQDARTQQAAFFSGDTRFDAAAYRMMEQAHICFHDTQLTEQDNPVHALLSELRTLPEALRRKTWLYHYGDEWDSEQYRDVPELFAGWTRPGHRYVILA